MSSWSGWPSTVMWSWFGLSVTFLFLWMVAVLMDLQRSEIIDLPRLMHLPVALGWAFAINYLASLMGLTIAVGLVVDDAIVVLENIMRHIEDGMAPRAAAFQGVREVGFTVISISIS